MLHYQIFSEFLIRVIMYDGPATDSMESVLAPKPETTVGKL